MQLTHSLGTNCDANKREESGSFGVHVHICVRLVYRTRRDGRKPRTRDDRSTNHRVWELAREIYYPACEKVYTLITWIVPHAPLPD